MKAILRLCLFSAWIVTEALRLPALCEESVNAWSFAPRYELPLNAANTPGPFMGHTPPTADFLGVEEPSGRLRLHGLSATHSETLKLSGGRAPRGSFTAELWLLDHVNRPVGAALGMLSADLTEGWVLAYHDRTAFAAAATKGRSLNEPLVAPVERRDFWKKWWAHLAMRSDGERLDLFLNGARVASEPLDGLILGKERSELEVVAYLENEPFMDLPNLVREARWHDRPLSEEEIHKSFQTLCGKVERGVYDEEKLHFVAGPYLHLLGRSSVRLSWETSLPTRAAVRYGTTIPLSQRAETKAPAQIHELELSELEPETNYYYEVVAEGPNGESVRSGTLTFRTAVNRDSPFRFAILGDTESRPHINDVIAKGIWAHRPNFVVNLGDLTDGGQRPHKFEWNFEYFAGMTQLHSRIPVMTVPGNGESDLHWYSRYHSYPDPENYYTFGFGDAQFFMLDSNRRIAPETDQYSWLERELKLSDATWKFVCHHHCAYSSDEDDYGDAWEGEPSYFVHKNVAPAIALYEKYGVDVVFFGHVHAFERSRPIRAGKIAATGGVRYVETGGGGGNLEDFSPFPSWFSRAKYRGHHFCLVDISETRFELSVIDLNGVPRDGFAIEK